ncbi:heme exporter protein C [Hymenobacter qilianensis]|uniref:Heme exporter protein C n=3 Tax=Hymenobacter qilianensis TaxID=1385715 RepID=A0ACB5PU23_9BACT|nr:cytochrome c biogenesis protein CcsA [Hymenobacter qilianensis]GGF71900.1 heme exporter protein C [Hymenobacter qilianensis]
MSLKRNWWKVLAIVLVLYTVVAGLLVPVPRLDIVNESIRNLYFHVPMWFGMTIILTTSVYYSIRYLRTPTARLDTLAHESAKTGIVMGMLGLATGSMWARYTWGAWWTSDPRLNGAAIAMLIYGAYIVLRSSFTDEQQRARISAVYNIFAFAAAIPLLFVLPRLTDSLHPGAGGNPGFSNYDLDSNMRMVFYPAVIGWTLIGFWITQVSSRLEFLKQKMYEKQLA